MGLSDFAAKLSATPIPWQLARTLSWILGGNAAITGLDYINTPETAPTARSLTIVERIATLNTWGIAFLAAGAVLTLGLVARRHAVVWLGHLMCSGLYGIFTIATAQAVIAFSRTPAEQAQGSIWRAITQSLVILALHIVLCFARGPVPRRGDER